MASTTTKAADSPPEVNRSRTADIASSFAETKQPFTQPDEPKLDNYERVAMTIDMDAPSTGKGGGALRPISDNFTVNPANGTLSLEFPLQIPAARSGFGPELSLTYDSGNGNGSFGLGWALTHAGSVSRRTSKAIPKFDDSDIFVLSGTQDLIPLLNKDLSIDEFERDGYMVRRFKPRVESQVMRIERWMRLDNHNEMHWRTISSTNVITIFGDSDDSRVFEIASDGRKNTLTWLATYSYDPFGNSIELKYKGEDGEGIGNQVWERSHSRQIRSRSRYLKAIKYGNRRPHRNLSTWEFQRLPDEKWMFEIILDYGEHDLDYPTITESKPWPVRRDPFSTCKGGFECRSYRLCRRILSFNHIQEGSEKRDYPVSSMAFSYTETEIGSFLDRMTYSTYQRSSPTELKVASLPPHTFKYSKMPSIRSLELETADTLAMETLSDARAKWLDLDGEGAPGLLVEHRDAAWSYQRNETPLYAETSGPKLGNLQWIDSQPSFKNEETHQFEDLDGNGVLDVIYRDQSSGYSGFSERRDNSWTNFTPFPANSTATNALGETLRIDLTGNGAADMLTISEETNEIVWQESLRKQGFGPTLRVKRQENGPTLASSNPTGKIYLADMTGDGMTDIVHISAGYVSYWPNLGYGRFGPEVMMGNPPRFDTYEQFDHKRLRLGDVDGSGTTDLIYLQREGGLKVFCNMAGNSWSAPQKNPRFPRMDNFASVFSLDLKGNGTSCLCWTGPSTSTTFNSSLHYFDFSGGQKRHLLVECSNGFGASVSFSFRPSTWFYLQDQRKGYSWSTKLSFPVHCIQQVSAMDHISQTKTTSTFAYHDGYYDGEEREFGGFSMVEKWDSEDFPSTGVRPFQRPQIHSKLWFHTGASNEPSDDSISHQSHPPRLASSTIKDLNKMSTGERYEAYRALRGMEIRKEIYSQNCPTSEETPYMTADSRYVVTKTQARAKQPYGSFKTRSREVLSTFYERQSDEPRVTHQLTLDVNDFGDVTKAVAIAYGSPKSLLNEENDKLAQETTIMNYYEREFTNAIKDELDNFRKPLLAASRTYVIRGFNKQQLFSPRELTQNEFSFFKAAKDVEISRANDPVASHQKVCITEKKLFYRSSDLAKRLDYGKIEVFSVIDQQYQFAFTNALLEATYGDMRTPTGQSLETWLVQGGWVELEKKSGRWWRPSSKCRFTAPSTGSDELQNARASFFIPTATIDPFDNTTLVQMDDYQLFPVKITDALGGVTYAKYSYTHLQPAELIEANGNRVQLALDSFGRTVGVANMGKVGESLGDSLEGFQSDLTGNPQFASFLKDPTPALALELLKNAGRRKILDYKRWSQSSALPNLEVNIARTTHYTDEGGDSSTISLTIDYLNGSGSTIQTVTLSAADTNGTPTQWHYNGWAVLDSKGNPVRKFRPTFGASHQFVPQCNVASPSTTLLYDPLDRLVGSLSADHTWRKTRNAPWTTVVSDTGNTILCPDLSKDPDVGEFAQSLETSTYLPSWVDSRRDASVCGRWEADAAEKSKQFANNPWTFHLDPLGRAILSITRDGAQELYMRQEFDVAGNPCASYDKCGRKVDGRVFDLLGNCIYLKNLDSGECWTFSDCTGKTVVSWNSRFVCKTRVYDALRREIQLWIQTPESKILASQTTYGDPKDSQASEKNTIGRIIEIKDQAGIHQSVEFDFKGNCILARHQMTPDYNRDTDWNSKVEMKTDESFTTSSKFDALNRDYQSTNALGNVTSRVFDLMGRLKSCSWRESPDKPEKTIIISKEYNADGQAIEVRYGNGTRVEFTYDEQTKNLRRKRTHHQRSSTRPVLEDLVYNYDCQGRITHVADESKEVVFFRNVAVDASKDYTYDVHGLLVRAEGREHLDFGINGGGECLLPYDQPDAIGFQKNPTDQKQVCRFAETYKYDAVDNIKSMQHEAIGGYQAKISGWTRNYHYEGEEDNSVPTSNRLVGVEISNRTSSYSYDGPEGLTGCMTSMPGYSRLGWDFNDRMRCSAKQRTKRTDPETTWYVYDASGSRVRKVTESSVTGQVRKTKETFFIGDVEIYKTYESDGTTVKTTKTTAEVNGDGKTALVESDSLSSVPAVLLRYLMGNSLELDDEGNLVSYEEYTPFGTSCYVACGQSIKAPSKYRYNSYERDSETGLYYCQARYYSPWLGRWMSPDPIGTGDGQNVYCYVSNDPVNFQDPSGTMRNNEIDPDATIAYNGTQENEAAQAGQDVPTQIIPATVPTQIIPATIPTQLIDYSQEDNAGGHQDNGQGANGPGNAGPGNTSRFAGNDLPANDLGDLFANNEESRTLLRFVDRQRRMDREETLDIKSRKIFKENKQPQNKGPPIKPQAAAMFRRGGAPVRDGFNRAQTERFVVAVLERYPDIAEEREANFQNHLDEVRQTGDSVIENWGYYTNAEQEQLDEIMEEFNESVMEHGDQSGSEFDQDDDESEVSEILSDVEMNGEVISGHEMRKIHEEEGLGKYP